MPLRRNTKIELLRRTPLFSGCSKRQLGEIAAIADEIEIAEGKAFIREGERGREFFAVIDGTVDVRKKGRRVTITGRNEKLKDQLGVPVVATRVTGTDAVSDGVTGLLVPARESAPLAAAVVELARNPQLRHNFSRAAVDLIRTRYAEPRVNQLWTAEYRRLARESFPDHALVVMSAENRI